MVLFRRIGLIGVIGVLLLPLASPVALAASKCKIVTVADLPITMNRMRPTIAAKINGKDSTFIIESGAFYSLISAATATEYGLKLGPAAFGFKIMGIGGSADARLTTVKEFGLIGQTLKNVVFVVGGSETSDAGMLGQDFLQAYDVEYNLAAGSIKLFQTDDCDNTQMAYWVKPDQAYSTMRIGRIDHSDASTGVRIEHVDRLNARTIGTAYINDKEISVRFDTGTPTSILSTKAAARAGIKIDSEGVVEAGDTGGIGRERIKTYIARFDSFKIGDGEEIKNAKLRIGDFESLSSDMLLGADFFISHRIFVATKEHRLYLTYNGGPVFDLSNKVVSEPGTEPSPDGATGQP